MAESIEIMSKTRKLDDDIVKVVFTEREYYAIRALLDELFSEDESIQDGVMTALRNEQMRRLPAQMRRDT